MFLIFRSNWLIRVSIMVMEMIAIIAGVKAPYLPSIRR